MKLLTPIGRNPKTALDSERFEGAILHLAPANTADGRHTVCPWATDGCRAACLNTSGRGHFRGNLTPRELPGVLHRARRARTLFYLRDRAGFLAQLHRELGNLQARADRRGVKAVCRLNGTSDIPWESVDRSLFTGHPQIQYYDYTKGEDRALESTFPWWRSRLPNYHLTLSYHEDMTLETAREAQRKGVSVAVVFADEATAFERCGEFLPAYPTKGGVQRLALAVPGWRSDWRFEDPAGSLVMLTAKGRAKRDATGFVVR